MSVSEIRAAVFAGGGNRCLWQAGFWNEAAPALGLRIDRVAAVSAGATIACLLLAGREGAAIEHFKEVTARNPRNIYPLNALRKRPMFPHPHIYRNAILHAIDEAALARLREGPDVRILVARPPAWASPRAAVLVGFAAYEGEKRVRPGVHPRAGRRIGFRPEIHSVRECGTPDNLADLLLASSCTPPFTPLMWLHGKPALDGGLVDNVPVEFAEDGEGKTLVLLTRRYAEPEVPRHPRRIYVQPSEEVPVKKWDYTNPDGVQRAYDLGRRDGARFAAQQVRRGG